MSEASSLGGMTGARRRSSVLALSCILALTLSAFVAARADDQSASGSPEIGAQRIRTAGCTTCHGRDGVSRLEEAPNLAGQVQGYLVSALRAYHSGDRKNEIMNTVAAPLSDEDIANLAAYYSSIKVSVTPPPRP